MNIETNLPQFKNDLMDVARIFYPPDAELLITHRHRAEAGQLIETARCGDKEAIHEAPEPTGSAIETARAVKRAAKTAVYQLLKARANRQPPWGSLTGIRPTRLFYEAMDEGLDQDAAERQLMHKYDVSPARAKLLGDIYAMQRGLIEREADEFDLYIGIPFCTTRCAYCSFSSGEIGKGRLVEPYIEALLREMEQSAALIQAKGLRPRAAYMGGGTPTSLSADQLGRILTRAQALFPGAREWTVEAGRPDTLDEPKLAALKAHNVGRISINPQTFSDETLSRIGRAHTAKDTRAAFALARSMGFTSINADLICALPGERIQDFQRTLAETLALDPEGVTVHTLAIKHGSRLNESGYAQAGSGEALAMVDFARETLAAARYRPYYLYRQKYMADNLENVGYAKRGHACLYNIDIMEETAPILALGAGAISKWLFPRERRIERAPNVKNIEQYISRVDEMAERKRRLIWEEEEP